MKVVAYAAGIPNPNKSPHKLEVLQRFVAGVNVVGDQGILHYGKNTIAADVAVIQGWVHDGSPRSPHLMLRKSAAENLLNKHTIIVDSNLFNYNLGKLHPSHYSRYSMDGVFPTTGNYFSGTVDPSRWQKISRDLQISLKPQRTDGRHILICLQRNKGWSMGSLSVIDWLNDTIAKIVQHTDRTIVIRAHPGDKKAITSYLPILIQRYRHNNKVKISNTGTPLEVDLKKAWAVVNHNSSSIVGPLIQGYPGFITDPIKSQCAEVVHTDFSMIEHPQQFDRQKWLERISMFHWNFDELSNGSAWRHMREYV